MKRDRRCWEYRRWMYVSDAREIMSNPETGCNYHCVNLEPKLTGTVHFGGVTIRQFFLYAYEFRLALLYSLCNDNLNKYFITRRLLKRYSFPFAMKVNHLYSSKHNYSDLVFLHICVRILHCVIGSIIRLLYKSRIIHALIFRKLKKRCYILFMMLIAFSVMLSYYINKDDQ